MQQRYRGALQAFRKQGRVFRNDAAFWGLYGTLCEYAAKEQQSRAAKHKLFKRAERYYRRATRLDRKDFLGWHGLWRLACNRREPQCITFFWKAHHAASRRGHMKCLGISYLVLGKPKRAVPRFQEALREIRAPHEKMAIHYDLAIAFRHMDQTSRARRHAAFAYLWLRKLPRSLRVTPAFRQTASEIAKMLTALSEHPKRKWKGR